MCILYSTFAKALYKNTDSIKKDDEKKFLVVIHFSLKRQN
jgi:hypothetical protein